MISIIIVTFNSGRYIEDCLSSIRATLRPEEYELIIVDNNSRDDTLEIIERMKRTIALSLIVQRENSGFTKGCNVGASAAKGEFLFFLNPDTRMIGGQNLTESVQKRPKTIIGFSFSNPDGTIQYSAGRFPTLLRVVLDRIPFFKKKLGMLIRDESFYTKPREADWVSGSGFSIPRKAYAEIGGFDERIFMYGEDIDFCYRAKLHGIRTIYCSEAQFIHRDSGKNERQAEKSRLMRIGLRYFFAKHRGPFSRNVFTLLIRIEKVLNLISGAPKRL